MSDSIIPVTTVKTLREASGLLFIPVTILAAWSQGADYLIPHVGGSPLAALLICCIIGFLGAIGLYQILAWVTIHTTYSLFPVLGTALVGGGLVVVFQDQMAAPVASLTQFTGAAMVVWGLQLDAVHDRVVVQGSHT